MFRQLLDEAFEELKQTVAPARPEISIPRPPSPFRPHAEPNEAPEPVIRSEARPAPREPAPAPAPVARPAAPVPRPAVAGPSLLRSQLSSPSSVRAAFRIMEVLGPPVALRDPLDRVHDR